jgi:glycosyltransferase involved in cell wall biosynthesis
MDEIWVPCQWNAEVAREGGVKVPVYVFGHCADPGEYNNIQPMRIPEIPKEWFKFYSIFQWTERKNPAGMIRAYLRSFRRKDPVILILKAYRSNYSREEQDAVLGLVDEVKKEVGGTKHPRIMVILDMLTRKQILSLHASGDCFVLLHRSEGWGLPHFEACAMGKPCISTRYGGNLEFMNTSNSFLVNYKMIPVEGMGWIPWYNNTMSWADPDVRECGNYMRYVYANRGMAASMGQEARALVMGRFTWKEVGEGMRKRLSEIMASMRR